MNWLYYAISLSPFIAWELSAFIFRKHPTLSKLIKSRRSTRIIAGIGLAVLFAHWTLLLFSMGVPNELHSVSS